MRDAVRSAALLFAFTVSTAGLLWSCGPGDSVVSADPGNAADVTGALATLQLTPSADVSRSRVTGVPSSSALHANVDDGVSYAASDGNTSYTRAYAGVGTGKHVLAYAGAPAGAAPVSAVTVRYTAALGTATSGTAQVRLYDGSTLLGTGTVNTLGTAFGQYADTFSGLAVASGNTLRTEMTLVNKAGSGGVRYSEIWLDVALASGSTDGGRADAGSQTDAGTRDGGSGTDAGSGADAGSATDAGTPGSGVDRVFVVMLENHDASDIYGSASAPYLNSLMQKYAYATNFNDVLPLSEVSESHYIWLEAGTNVFPDIHFTGDAAPSASHSTSSTAHLSSVLDAAGVSWMSYQEDLTSSTGACPIAASGSYAPKHDPFIFFQDVSGNPPSKTSTRCAAHHKPFTALAQDLAQGSVARYALITPNLCNDMHDNCGGGGAVSNADAWLASNLPAVIAYAEAHRGLVLVTWDEGSSTTKLPFIVIGNGLKSAGFANNVSLSMSSVLKSLQQVFKVSPSEGVPFLGHAADASTNDLGDFFKAGAFP